MDYDQRGDKRFKYEAAIWHENILPGRFYRAKICNISQTGLYFESDQTLYQGEKIYIGNKNPDAAKNMANDCAGVQIRWRKDLENSTYRYGYGAKFLDPDNQLIYLFFEEACWQLFVEDLYISVDLVGLVELSLFQVLQALL